MTFDAVLCGVFYLVPGTIGLRSGLALMSSDAQTAQGAGFALAMIESAISIAVGLFASTLLVYPRGANRTPLMSF